MPSKLEIEIKLPLPGAAHGRALLRKAGFSLTHKREFESNVVLDTPDRSLRNGGCLLRVREHGARRIVTFKQPSIPGKHRSRPETEFEVSDIDAAAAVFESLGFTPAFRYEKFRSEYQRLGERGVAMLDHTPIGDFLELEGSPRWIDRIAKAIGFRECDYITVSYGQLYFAHCLERGVEPGHMVFERHSVRAAAPRSRRGLR